MSYNRIIAKTALGVIIKDGKSIALSAATETSQWKRPDFAVQAIKDPATTVIQNYEHALPVGTVEVCVRESEYSSPTDQRDHFTGVCIDQKGNGTSVHFPTK